MSNRNNRFTAATSQPEEVDPIKQAQDVADAAAAVSATEGAEGTEGATQEPTEQSGDAPQQSGDAAEVNTTEQPNEAASELEAEGKVVISDDSKSLNELLTTKSDPQAPVAGVSALITDFKKEDSGDVQDTTSQGTQPAPAEPTIAASARVQDRTVVRRPVGASPRQSSPQNSTGLQVQPVAAEFSSLVATIRNTGTASAVTLVSFMETYVERMKPGKITPSSEIQHMQSGLYDQLINVIEYSPANEFKRLWNIAIAFVKQYGDAAFSPVYYSRGAKDWKRDPQQFTILTNLLNLLQVSATDLETLNEQVSVSAVMANGFSEEARGRMIGFYMKK